MRRSHALWPAQERGAWIVDPIHYLARADLTATELFKGRGPDLVLDLGPVLLPDVAWVSLAQALHPHQEVRGQTRLVGVAVDALGHRAQGRHTQHGLVALPGRLRRGPAGELPGQRDIARPGGDHKACRPQR